MQDRSVRTEYIKSIVITEYLQNIDKSICKENFQMSFNVIKEDYPHLNEDEILSIIDLLVIFIDNELPETSLVATIPTSFKIKVKQTESVVKDLIENAKSSIIITGYSVSDFVNEFMDIIIDKSQKGIYVKVFLNNIENQEHVDKLIRYKSRYLRIYNYSNKKDKMSALHAKIISVDENKTLISSANLSYHGMNGNIEVGSLIESKRIANQIEDLFNQLIINKVFIGI